MAEQIDDLFVKLGLETDQREFQQANQQFSQLQTRVLQFGAAIGAGFGLRELTMGFADATHQTMRLAEVFEGLGVKAEFIHDLGNAFRLIDEDASEAERTVRGIANLIEQTEWGEISSDAFRHSGFDPRVLEDVESVEEGVHLLNDALSDMDPEQARRALEDIGLGSDAQIRMLRDQDVGALMEQAGQRSPLTEGMQEDADRFQQGFSDLAVSMEGLQNALSEGLGVGELGDTMTGIADWLDENRDAISEFTESALPYLRDAALGIGILVALQSARAGLGVVAKVPGTVALAAGIGIGGGMLARNLQDSPEAQEQLSSTEAVFQERFAGPGATMPLGEAEEWLADRDRRRDEPDDTEETSEPSLWDRIMDQMRGGTGDPSVAPMAAPDVQAMGGPGAGTTNNTTVTVDARGSSDPQAVQRAVEQGLARAAENTILDVRTDTR